MPWRRLSAHDELRTLKYLLDREERHVALSSKFFLKKGIFCWPKSCLTYGHAPDHKTDLDGMVYCDNRGYVAVSLNKPTWNYSFSVILEAINRFAPPYCFIGLPDAVQVFESGFLAGKQLSINYYLMARPASLQLQRLAPMPLNAVLKQSSLVHFEGLKHLEQLYQLEEVIVKPNAAVNMSLILNHYKKKLNNEFAFHLELNDKPIAKAALSAQGFSFAMVGGVFVEKPYRRQGCAAALIAALAQAAAQRNIGLTLFVKQTNQAAFNLYKSLGFDHIAPYRIAYQS